jgi:hypothetical protein
MLDERMDNFVMNIRNSRPSQTTQRCTSIALLLGFGLAALFASCAPPSPTAPTVQTAQTQVVGTVQGAATQAAPTVQAAATQVAPTAQAAGTAMTAQRQATATALAPTAQAVGTQIAPTVQAAATQAVGAVSTSVASSPVQIVTVKIDPVDTTIDIRNSGTNTVNLRNWTLLIGPIAAITLEDYELSAGQTRTLHFSPGTDTSSDIYLGLGSGVMSRSLTPNDRVVLVMPSTQIASIYPLM